jgi:oligosaccharyltransferase complex subunit delta (ribophorin II)
VDLLKSGESEFQNRNGTYEIRVLVADDNGKKYDWVAGQAQLSFMSSSAFVAKQEHSEEKLWQKRPEITHIFRKPERRAPKLFSMAFTALTLVPFLVLFVMLGKVGANFSNFPTTADSLRALIFHGVLAVMLLIIVSYWLFLTIFPTIFFLLCGGLVAFIFRPRSAERKTKAE